MCRAVGGRTQLPGRGGPLSLDGEPGRGPDPEPPAVRPPHGPPCRLRPTNQVVPDIHVAERLCQDGARLLHPPVGSRVQGRPAVVVLDVQVVASLDQQSKEGIRQDACILDVRFLPNALSPT